MGLKLDLIVNLICFILMFVCYLCFYYLKLICVCFRLGFLEIDFEMGIYIIEFF